jgi:hypothetical protein
MICNLNKPCLVLNKSWTPINFSTFKRAINKVIAGKCHIINPITYQMYAFVDWYNFQPDENYPFLEMYNRKFLSPEVIISSTYGGVPKTEIKLSRKNI